MLYNKCYQCQEKDQVLGTSFCSVECKQLYLQSEKAPQLDTFARKLADFKKLHVQPKTDFDEAVEYMDKIMSKLPEPQNNESSHLA